MADKTKNLIMEILGGESGLEVYSIRIKLGLVGHSVTLDTVARNLKGMVDDGKLIRYARGGEVNENTRRKHWHYRYYKIKETKTS